MRPKNLYTEFCDAVISYGINLEELLKLQEIGGHKIYHLEGDAFQHTMLVWEAMCYHTNEVTMQKAAVLHDIGKIYTSIKHGENDWEYPDHSTAGSLRGILSKFYSEENEDFKAIQWLIANHIKPLFWKDNKRPMTQSPNLPCCDEAHLAMLATADIEGSKCIPSKEMEQLERLSYLWDIWLPKVA